MASLAFASGLPVGLISSSRGATLSSRRHYVSTVRSRGVSRTSRCICMTNRPIDTSANGNATDTGTEIESSFEWENSMGMALSSLIAAGIASVPAGALAEIPPVLVETFKSKPASLAHPATMWLLFGGAIYTGFLGWQSKSIRSVDPEKRKELVKAKVTKRHFDTSATIFFIMTFATFSGMANTYTRTGKLFPGPHLYAGLGLVTLMSAMSALVPQMQAGKMWAKNAHFTLAFPAILLFAWQANSGMTIVGKLLGWA